MTETGALAKLITAPWRYMAATPKHHMSSNKTRRAELAWFLIGVTVSGIFACALTGLVFLVVRAVA